MPPEASGHDPRTRVLLEGPLTRTLLRLAAPNVLVMFVQASIGLIEAYFIGWLGTDALAGVALAFPILMLMQMMSSGAMGGGISSAIARALGGGLVGTNIGAGQRERALRAAWIGAGIVAVLTEAIGLAAAAFPHAWLGLFDSDPAMLEAGALYLRTVGPFYGLFGLGMALYFASQGAGRLKWPLLANLMRLAIAAGGGWLALHLGGTLAHVFLAQSVALAAFGLIVAGTVWAGTWFGRVSWPR